MPFGLARRKRYTARARATIRSASSAPIRHVLLSRLARSAEYNLAWWSAALEKARAGGELLPGTFRLRAALAPAN